MIEKKEIFKLLESVISRTSDQEEQKYILMDLIIHYFSESQDFTKIAQQICSDFKIDLPEQVKSQIEKQKEKQKEDENSKKLTEVNKKLIDLQKAISESKTKPDRWFPDQPYHPGKFKEAGPYWVNPNDDDFKYTVTCDSDTNLNENYYKYSSFINDEKFKIYKNGGN